MPKGCSCIFTKVADYLTSLWRFGFELTRRCLGSNQQGFKSIRAVMIALFIGISSITSPVAVANTFDLTVPSYSGRTDPRYHSSNTHCHRQWYWYCSYYFQRPPRIYSRPNRHGNEDEAYQYQVKAYDPNGDTLTYRLIRAPQGMVIDAATGLISWHSPRQGRYRVVIKVTDGRGGKKRQRYRLRIKPSTNINQAPVAFDSSIETISDQSVTFNLQSTDTDNDPLTYIISDAADNGTVTVLGSLATYQPSLNYVGSDSFTFVANDGSLNSNTATVSINVLEGNRAPVAESLQVTLDEDTTARVIAKASDEDGDALSYRIVVSPQKGSARFDGNQLIYTPVANINGQDELMWVANDGALDSNTVAASFNISAVNDVPTLSPFALQTSQNTAVTVTLNGTDIDSDTLSYQVVGTVDNGTVSINGNQLTFTPAAGFSGSGSFQLVANDGITNSASTTVSFSVTSTNASPVAESNTVSVNEDESVVFVFEATDPDGDDLSYQIVSQPSQGNVLVSGNQVTYTPNTDYAGTDSLSFNVNDGELDSNVATVVIDVQAVNDAPVAFASEVNITEDGNAKGQLFATDVDDTVLTFSLSQAPINGVVSVDASGAYTYGPDTNFVGTDSFEFTVSDGNLSSSAIISITVDGVNDAPVAVDGAWQTDENTSVVLTLSASDAEQDTLTYAVVTQSQNGTVSVSGNQATYTPSTDFSGTDTFTFTANDGQADSNVATVTITVTDVNTAPVAVDFTQAVQEDVESLFLLRGTDADNDALTYRIISQPDNGTLVLDGNTVTYSPAANYNGDDSFTYQISDGSLDSNIATVSLSVGAINDAPVSENIEASGDEDTTLTIPLVASDVDGDPLTFELVGAAPAFGTVEINDGVATVTPDKNYNGTFNFTYLANDGVANSNTAMVTLVINPVNDLPVALDSQQSTAEDTAVLFELQATDVESDSLAFAILTSPSHGVAALNGSTVTYTPNSNFNGTDTFTFTASDAEGASLPATVSISIGAINDAPVAENAALTTLEDQSLNLVLKAIDGDNDSLSYRIDSDPTHGTVTLDGDQVIYTPSDNYNGEDSFTFVANDGTIDSNTATVAITLTPVNDAPVAVNDSQTLDEDTSLTFDLIGTDVENSDLSFTVTVSPVNGVLNQDEGVLTYTPDPDFYGSDSVKFTVNDGELDSLEAEVILTVNAVNDAPVFSSDPELEVDNTVDYRYALTATDVDNDTSELSFAVVNAPTGMSINTDNELVWSASDSTIGIYNIEISVSDQEPLTTVQTFTLSVGGNQPPLVSSDLSSSWREGLLTQEKFDVTDPEGGRVFVRVAEGKTLPAGVSLLYIAEEPYFRWTPEAAGDYLIELEFFDENGGVTAFSQTLNVPGNQSPVVNSDLTSSWREGSSTREYFDVTDPEGLLVSVRVAEGTSLPENMSIGGDLFGLYIQWTPEAAGDYLIQLEFVNEDGFVTSFNQTLTAVDNLPPVIHAELDTDWVVGQVKTSRMPASDPEGTRVVMRVAEGSSLPSGAVLQLVISTYRLRWEPTEAGDYLIELEFVDEDGGITPYSQTVTVAPNLPPVLNNDLTSSWTELFDTRIYFDVEDPEGTSVNVRVPEGKTLPDGAAVSKNINGPYFQWTPEASGDYTIELEFYDGDGYVTAFSQTLTVAVNQPPVVERGLPSTWALGLNQVIQLLASDPEGRRVTVRESTDNPLPSGVSLFVNSSGALIFNWTPDTEGTYQIEFEFVDAEGFVTPYSQSITVGLGITGSP